MMVQDINKFAVGRFLIQWILCDLYEEFAVSMIPAVFYHCPDTVLYIVAICIVMGRYIRIKDLID